MIEKRNRAAGWQHAKLSGHANECTIEKLLQTDVAYQQAFLSKVGKASAQIAQVAVSGLYEKDVPCVFVGEKTKSKTDLQILLNDGTKYNVSIKKSLGGQVYLITGDRFIQGYEKQYGCVIPAVVKRAIELFWGTAADTKQIIAQYGTHPAYENRKHRLVGDSLQQYDEQLYQALVSWFAQNISTLIDFCFSKGLAQNPADWADIVWYKNELGENAVDEVFLIQDMRHFLSNNAPQTTKYSTRGGGTTIWLPFGFVQWHSPSKSIPGCMQFHHSYKKIKAAQQSHEKEEKC